LLFQSDGDHLAKLVAFPKELQTFLHHIAGRIKSALGDLVLN